MVIGNRQRHFLPNLPKNTPENYRIASDEPAMIRAAHSWRRRGDLGEALNRINTLKLAKCCRMFNVKKILKLV